MLDLKFISTIPSSPSPTIINHVYLDVTYRDTTLHSYAFYAYSRIYNVYDLCGRVCVCCELRRAIISIFDGIELLNSNLFYCYTNLHIIYQYKLRMKLSRMTIVCMQSNADKEGFFIRDVIRTQDR